LGSSEGKIVRLHERAGAVGGTVILGFGKGVTGTGAQAQVASIIGAKFLQNASDPVGDAVILGNCCDQAGAESRGAPCTSLG